MSRRKSGHVSRRKSECVLMCEVGLVSRTLQFDVEGLG